MCGLCKALDLYRGMHSSLYKFQEQQSQQLGKHQSRQQHPSQPPPNATPVQRLHVAMNYSRSREKSPGFQGFLGRGTPFREQLKFSAALLNQPPSDCKGFGVCYRPMRL